MDTNITFLHDLTETYTTSQEGVATMQMALQYNGADLAYFTGRLSNGVWYFYGVKETIKAYMEKNNLTYREMVAAFSPYDSNGDSMTEESITMPIIYTAGPIRHSAANVSTSAFLASRFLVSSLYGTSTTIWYYATEAESGTKTYTYADGTETVVSFTGTSGLSTISLPLSPTCIKIVVTLGSRTYTGYYLPGAERILLRFRNFFNALESIAIPASLTRTPSTEFETAQVENTISHYDVEHKTTFTLQTAPLPVALRQSLEQLCRSRAVSIRDDNGYSTYLSIVVNSYEIPSSDNPNTPLTLKMEYEYKDATKGNMHIDM